MSDTDDVTKCMDCKICMKPYYDECQPTGPKYRKRILKICSRILVAEMGVDWSSCTTQVKENLQFCPVCLETVEDIGKLFDYIEKAKSEIQVCIHRFMKECMRGRQSVMDATSAFPNVKIEKGDKCVSCYQIYDNTETTEKEFTNEEKLNIVKQCRKYLYQEYLTTSMGFDWDAIPLLTNLPFCSNCLSNIEKVVKLGSNIENMELSYEEKGDGFMIQVFECRHEIRRKNAMKSDILFPTSCKMEQQEASGGGPAEENLFSAPANRSNNSVEVEIEIIETAAAERVASSCITKSNVDNATPINGSITSEINKVQNAELVKAVNANGIKNESQLTLHSENSNSSNAGATAEISTMKVDYVQIQTLDSMEYPMNIINLPSGNTSKEEENLFNTLSGGNKPRSYRPLAVRRYHCKLCSCSFFKIKHLHKHNMKNNCSSKNPKK